MHYTHTPGDYTQIDTFRVSFGLQLLFSIYVLLRSFQNFPPWESLAMVMQLLVIWLSAKWLLNTGESRKWLQSVEL